MAGLNIWKTEYHIVRVELKGPKSKEELLRFDDALRRLVEESGGSVRILAKEKDREGTRAPKQSRRSKAKRPKRSRRTR